MNCHHIYILKPTAFQVLKFITYGLIWTLPWMFLRHVNICRQCTERSRLTLPSHVKNLPVSLEVVVAMTFSMDDTEYSTLIIPSTCQPTEISAAISLEEKTSVCTNTGISSTHVVTSPGCIARTVVSLPFLCSSAAIC